MCIDEHDMLPTQQTNNAGIGQDLRKAESRTKKPKVGTHQNDTTPFVVVWSKRKLPRPAHTPSFNLLRKKELFGSSSIFHAPGQLFYDHMKRFPNK